jgi:hypothetical protein
MFPMWKNKIPKEMPIYPDYAPDRPILTQQVYIISATKNWIRKVITDLSPSLPYGDKWKLTVAWPFVEWEQIDEDIEQYTIRYRKVNCWLRCCLSLCALR